MKRLTLSGQVALAFALALTLAQIISLLLTIDNRRDQMIERAVLPGAERIVLLAQDPERLDRRQAIEDRIAQRVADGARTGRGGRPRVRVSADNPIPASAADLPLATEALSRALDTSDIDFSDVRAARLSPAAPRSGERRGRMMMAARIEDGRWLYVSGPGPRPLRPIVIALLFQYLLIGLLVLVPTLLILRRVGGSLRALADSAERFDGHRSHVQLDPSGPRDVAALIASVNAMQDRIVAMIGEKDVMLGAIGHDLRTPLTALRLEAEAVEEQDRRDALIDQLDSLHSQFEAILELARASRPLQYADVAPVSIIRSMLDDYRAEAKDVALLTQGEKGFEGDPRAVMQAVRNLVDNGLRHGNKVEIHVLDPQDAVVIQVTDDGPGIPPAERERLRRPFERTEASRNRATGGHGLGLAIVEAIMRRHGGRLELDGRADGAPGLVARLVFPVLRL